MKKVMLYIAESLDGYIAGPNGELDWLPETPGEDYGYHDFIKGIDTTLMGAKTYEFVLSVDDFPYKDKRNVIFTRSKSLPKSEYVEFCDEDIVQFTQNLKMGEGKDIWLIGGGQIIAPLIEANMVDEYFIAVCPVILGRGIPLFKGIGHMQKLSLISAKNYASGLVMLHFGRNRHKSIVRC